ncbi:MAG: hypothetical protein J5898_03355 [Lachnospiraceae bacterium]|nr:hypothetical protein [Lachnospiraceae bacterium]
MASYSDKKKVGGKINSKIDNQDSVAAVLAVEQMNSPDIFHLGCHITDFCVKCEGDEDIEIFNTDEHIYIQVKSSAIGKSDFLSILADFLQIDRDETCGKNYFVLLIFDDLIVDNKNIGERMKDYVRVYENEYESPDKVRRVREELINDFHLSDYESIIDRLRIERRPLFRSSNDTEAIFGRTMRLYYTIRDAGDRIVSQLYGDLTEKFAEARRIRGAVKKNEIETMLNRALCRNTYYSSLALMEGYKKIENGYVRDEKMAAKQKELAMGYDRARKNLLRGWRKSHFKEILLSMLRGAKPCPQCGHPMMANFYGLFGIACPDCGYSPYVTMFTFCECGEFEVIKRQPDFAAESQIQYIQDYVNQRPDSVCRKCGRELFDEYFEQRIFYAPIPYPYDQLMGDEEMYKNSPY